MRAGVVSAAALRVNPEENPLRLSLHCSEEEYAAFVNALPLNRVYRRRKRLNRRQFVERWPDLNDWFAAPLVERIGGLTATNRHRFPYCISRNARPYLLFLGLRGYAHFDYEWLLGIGQLQITQLTRQLGLDLGLEALAEEAIQLGFSRESALQAMSWAVIRLVLHTGNLDPQQITNAHIEQFLNAVHRFAERPDIIELRGSTERFRLSASKDWTTKLHQLQVVLFHRGQIDQQPRKYMPSYCERAPTPPAMQALVDRWLAARRLTDRPATVARLELSMHQFLTWLSVHEPQIEQFTEVTREHLLAYLTVLTEAPSKRTGKPLSQLARRGRLSSIASFFRDTARWGWDEVPGRPLLSAGDLPKIPTRIPRFIPAEELERVMAAVVQLDCPYQRAAVLVARWSGARKGEIRRLAVDCLDHYPDGTARLRLPAGKTYRERIVPLHEQAAQALREVIALRAGRQERAFIDEFTEEPTHFLFMDRGKLLSDFYLFIAPLRKACTAAGLVDAAGRPTISMHRFRHTVGTQLAERGAKLHTIMSILGHRSVSMALVYAQISDPEVLRDYQAVLGPGAVIAGPGAEALHSGALTNSAIDWLKCNFFKTELELGHCLRLPAEGPCECDLYLNCAKFVTTPAYVPRLRERHAVELALAKDAEDQGWSREVERHRATALRIEQLLTELGESLGLRSN